MPKVNVVKAARKDYPDDGIKKGETYYWWKFNFSKFTHRSKTAPTRSQLTQSDFLSTIWNIEDTRIAKFGDTLNDESEVQTEIDDIKSELETLRDEQEEKKDNMPEGLQQGSVGEMLQSRYDSLDEMINELDAVDTNYDEPDEDEIKKEVAEESELDTDVEGWEEQVDEEAVQAKKDEHFQEWLQGISDEVQAISYGGE